MKIFSSTKRITVNTGGSAFTDSFSINVKAAESSSVPTDTGAFALALAQSETNAAPSEAVSLGFSGAGINDSNTVPTDARTAAIRVWGTGASDNDSSRTAPANSNGQNDAVFSDVTTNQALGDLTNPVTLTSGAFTSVPSSGTFSSKLIRVYFNIPARILSLDTITMSYNIGAGDVVIYTHSGTASVDHNSGTFTFDISGLTLAQCQALTLKANYLASVVATPETVLNLDAWAIELVGTI